MEREISLKELFDVIWKGKWVIAIAAVATFILAAVGAFVYDGLTSKVSTIVAVQWDGVDEGLYPDGTNFEYSAMIPAHVYTIAVDEEGLDIQANDVRNAMTIQPIVPENILAQIEKALENGETLTYYATDFKWTLNNSELGISVTEASDLLTQLRVQLKDDFARKYINQLSVLDFTDVDFDEYDYLDAYEILNAQVTAIDNVMGPRSDIEFTSSSGYTFSDILVRTDLLKRIELNQIITRTNNYLLTKDKPYLITSYQYRIEQAQFALNKTSAKEVEVQGLVDNYKEINNIVIPGLEGTTVGVDTYYAELLASLVTLQNEIADLTYDIDYYEIQIDRLNGTDPTFTVTPEQQAEEIVKVESNISTAINRLDEIINDVEVLLANYNEYLINSDTVVMLLAPEYESSLSIIMISVIGLVLGAGISGLVILFRHEWN